MDIRRIEKLKEGYLEDRLNSDELSEFIRFMDDDPALKKSVSEELVIKRSIQRHKMLELEENIGALWDAKYPQGYLSSPSSRESEGGGSPNSEVNPAPKIGGRPWWKIAAIILLLATFIILLRSISSSSGKPSLAHQDMSGLMTDLNKNITEFLSFGISSDQPSPMIDSIVQVLELLDRGHIQAAGQRLSTLSVQYPDNDHVRLQLSLQQYRDGDQIAAVTLWSGLIYSDNQEVSHAAMLLLYYNTLGTDDEKLAARHLSEIEKIADFTYDELLK